MAEKEYVLGNKTKDLLAYSFVVTKPIGDKTLEISEVIKMLGTIKSLPPEARDDILAQYLDRLEKANSRQGFPKSALHTYIKTVREIGAQVSEIIGTQLRCHAPIRLSKTQKAMLEYKKRRKASQKAALEAAPPHHDGDPPW